MGGNVRQRGPYNSFTMAATDPTPDEVRSFIAAGLACEHVEVAPAAREAVRADEDAGVVAVAPLHPAHAVEAVGAQALHRPFTHRGLRVAKGEDTDEHG